MTIRRSAAVGTVVAALAAGAVYGAGGAATVPVSGKLIGGKGMRVIAIAPSGSSWTSPVSSSGAFSLKLPKAEARGVTLHLADASGRYVGPVVLRTAKKSASMSLAGTPVRGARIKVLTGYARVIGKLPPAATLAATVPADAAGKPRGAGKLGLVVTNGGPRITALAGDGGGGGGPGGGGDRNMPGADPDRDGIPSAIDADDNGNGTLDGVDPAQVSSGGLFSSLFMPLADTLNANAGGVTDAQIDAVISGDKFFAIDFFTDGGLFGVDSSAVSSIRVDCGALPYCARGTGSATIHPSNNSIAPFGSRWVDYSPDGSGLPNLGRASSSDGRASFAMSISPRVPTSQIRPGDLFGIEAVTKNGTIRKTISLASYFVTVPAVKEWGSPGALTTQTYPVDPVAPGTSDATPKVLTNGRLRVVFWRPQRTSIPGAEAPGLRDIGRLHYGLSLATRQREVTCEKFYSDLSPTLTIDPASATEFDKKLWPLRDSGNDGAPSPDSTLAFTIDIAGCLASQGLPSSGITIGSALAAVGESRPGGNDRVTQSFVLRLP